MTTPIATPTHPIRVTDPSTGMWSVGYAGQTEEQLRVALEYRRDQLSVVPLVKTK